MVLIARPRVRRTVRLLVVAVVVAGAFAGVRPALAGTWDMAGSDAAVRALQPGRGGHDLPPIGAYLRSRGRFTTFDAPQAELETAASGINDRGDIAGGYVDGNGGGRAHGFVLRHRRFATFDVPGASDTVAASTFLTYPGSGAFDINDAGQVVGAYSSSTGVARGFSRDRHGRFTRIDVPDAVETLPFGVNDRGEIVGVYLGADGMLRSFLRDTRGRFTTIDAPRAFATAIFDIDDDGRMVGAYFESQTSSRGLLRDARGRITTFAAPGAVGTTAARGLNSQGQVVGQYTDSQGATHGFLRTRDGRVTTIDPRGAAGFSVASRINDRDQIIGIFQRPERTSAAGGVP